MKYWKKQSIVVLIMLMVIIVSACAASTSETPLVASDAVDVYYLSNDPAAAHIINSVRKNSSGLTVNPVAFDSVEEMDLRISTETIGGSGADVILFSSGTTLDTAKMVQNGSFLDLTTYLTEDAGYTEEAYYPVLDAGKADGKQQLMPLRFRLQYLLTSQEKLEKAGVLLKGVQTTAQLFAELEANAKDCGALESAMQCLFRFDPTVHLYDTIRLTGVPILDQQSKTLLIQKASLQGYADYGKLAHGQILKSEQILKKYSRDFVGGVSKLTTMLSNTSLPFQMRYYDALFAQGLNEKLQIVTFPSNYEAGTLTADISLYAAVLKDTDQPQEAYEFVRFAMDTSSGDITNDLPVSRESTAALLENLCQYKGKNINIGSMTVTISPMTEALRDDCESILERIGGGSIRNGAVEEIFTETMGRYITGEAEFDICWAEFQNRVELYLYE